MLTLKQTEDSRPLQHATSPQWQPLGKSRLLVGNRKVVVTGESQPSLLCILLIILLGTEFSRGCWIEKT